MRVRYELIINGMSTDLSNRCVKNWDDIQYSFVRKDYTGITRSISTKFEFVGIAYDLILAEWYTNGLKANAEIVIKTMTDRWEYEELFRCPLDFSTLSYDLTTLSINGMDQSIAAKVKAYGKTTYEFPVAELKEPEQLFYRHIKLQSSTMFKVNGDNVVNDDYENDAFDSIDLGRIKCGGYTEKPSGANYFLMLPLFYQEDGDNYAFSPEDTIKETITNVSKGSPFCTFVRDSPDTEISFDISITLKKAFDGGTDNELITWVYSVTPELRISKITDKVEEILERCELSDGQTSTITRTIHSDFIVGDKLIAYIVIPHIYNNNDYLTVRWEKWVADIYKSSTIDEDGNMLFSSASAIKLKTITEAGTDDETFIDVIKPSRLAERLLCEVVGRDITCEIDPSGEPRLDNALVIAAESVRDLSDAKIHTSYNNFSEWMEYVFGYVPVIDEVNSKVRFMHRDKMFGSFDTKKLTASDISVSFSVPSSIVYSSLKIGYNKADYGDTQNGRDEFRTSWEYNTGCALCDKALTMISPYRADGYGMEFLVLNRKDKSAATESDNDVFFICADIDSDTSKYEFVRAGYKIHGVISPESMFNVMYSPASMIEANKRYLASFIDSLTFASSDGNHEVQLNGEPLDADITLSEGLFMPLEASVKSTYTEPETDIDSIFEFDADGRIYCGYLKEVKYSLAVNAESEYKLIIKSVEL